MNIGVILAFLVPALGPGQSTAKSSASKVYEASKESVFQIETNDGSGTGFLFKNSTTVATCYHVIKDATSISIKGSRGGTWDVKDIRVNVGADLALLTIEKPSTRKPILPSTQDPVVGQPVYVIGNPLGFLTSSLSEGIVSGLRTTEHTALVQVTAPISHGSSGSPVLDDKGHVTAIVSFTFSSGQSLNMGVSSGTLNQLTWASDAMPVKTFYSRSLTALAGNVKGGKGVLSAEQNATLIRCVTRLVQANISLVDMETTSSDKLAFSQSLSNYWSGANQSISDISQLANLTPIVDRFCLSAERYARGCADVDSTNLTFPPLGATQSDYADFRQRIKAARENSTVRHKELLAAYSSFFQEMLIINNKIDVSRSLDAACFFALFGEFVVTSVSGDYPSNLVPDFNFPNECVVAASILGTGGKDLLSEYFRKNSSATYDEGVNKCAVISAGERVYSVKIGAEDWVDVRDWRQFDSEIARVRVTGKRVSGQLYVGKSRSAARLVDIWVGIEFQ